DVVGEEISGDEVECFVFRDVPRALADDDSELNFPVELARSLREHRVVVRAADAGGGLVEDDRLDRDRHPGFSRVIRIVQPDGDEIAHARNAGPEPRLAAHQREFLNRLLANAREPLGRERLPGDVRDHTREIANATFAVEDAGFFAPRRAVTDKLHGYSLSGS